MCIYNKTPQKTTGFFIKNYLAAFFALIFIFITYQSSVAIQIDEYVPTITPQRSGSANSLIDATPMIRSISTVAAVVKDVLKDLESVCVILSSAHFLKFSSSCFVTP